MIEQVKEAWIVLDALDECSTRKGGSTEGLISWISDIVNSEQRNIHLLVTSRQEQDILAEFDEWVDKSRVLVLSELISSDIRSYVHTKVREGSGLKRWQSRQDVQDEIQGTLVTKANGM